MNLSILDGRAQLWQWDTGIRLVMDEACEAVNISASTFGVSVDVTAAEDGKTWVAAVPDEMLQVPGDLICYAVQTTDTGTITAAYRSFRINRRPKPYGYVATPTEARTWQELDDKKIDAPQVAQAGEVLTVEEVDEDGKPKKWKTAPGVRGEKGETGPVGPKGTDGKDGAGMDVTGAKVGQIAKITAVDAAGKPTEWEPVDMPSGGGETWEVVADITVEEAAASMLAEFDPCKKIKIILFVQHAVSGNVLIYPNTSSRPGGSDRAQIGGFSAPTIPKATCEVIDFDNKKYESGTNMYMALESTAQRNENGFNNLVINGMKTERRWIEGDYATGIDEGISKILISSNAETLGATTRLTIYGVKV